MTLVVVTTSYPRHADDPAGGFVRASVLGHLQAGRRVEVFAAGEATAFDGREIEAHGERLQITRVPFPRAVPLFYAGGAPECFEARPFAAGVAAFVFWGALVTALRARLCAPARPSVSAVESHWLAPSAVAVAAVGHRGPHRCYAHSGDVALLEKVPGGGAVARWLLRQGVKPVFVSGDLRARFARLLADPVLHTHVMRSEVEAATSPLLLALAAAALPTGQASDPSPPRARRFSSAPVLLAVGRLVPIKGHDRLIRAVGGLPRDARPAVVILGAGPEADRLRRRANALGVKLDLPGEVSQHEVRGWLERATLFVHPARRLPSGRTEGTPVALREARAAGVPIVAVASGGVGEWAAGELLHGPDSAVRLLPDGDDAAVVPSLRAALTDALAQSVG